MPNEYEVRVGAPADKPKQFRPSLEGQRVRLTLTGVYEAQLVNPITGETADCWRWLFITDDGHQITNHSTASVDVRAKAIKWMRAMDGGELSSTEIIPSSYVGKSLVATLTLKPKSQGGLLLIGEDVEPDRMTPEQRATITELQRAAGLTRESLGLLRREITNKPTSSLMTFADADNLITALRARERHD
jgi:hypothetical protein